MSETQVVATIRLLVLVCAAYICAGIIVQFISVNIPVGTPAVYTGEKAKTSATTFFNIDHYKTVWEKNIFNPGGKASPVSPVKVEEKKLEEKEEEEDIPLSSLNYKLIGTVVGPAEHSFAIILVPEQRKHMLYRIGDMVENAEIKKIRRNKVILENNGREELLEVKFDEGRGRSTFGVKSRHKKGLQDRGIKKVSANRYILDREEVNRLSGDVTQFMTQVRVVPNIVRGKPNGYKLRNIKKGSIIEGIGLQNNDIVKSINGKSINRPEEAFMAYQQLKDGGSFSIEIERGGKRETISYEIR